MRPAAILFDLDGVVIDSEPLHHRAYEAALEPFGVSSIPFEIYAEHWTSRGEGLDFAERTWGADPERVKSRKNEVFLDLLRAEVELRNGASEAIESLGGRWPLALATNSARKEAEIVLERFGLSARFRVVVGREDYPRPKPAPDSFLEAARRLGVDPADCVAVEDSSKGLLAALSAGIPCIAVPNDYTRHADFSRAALVLDGMDELTMETVGRVRSG